jgi:hypothetical protein
MAKIVRISPPLTDDGLIEWIGFDGATTQAVAGRFSWEITETRKRLKRLEAAGRLTSELSNLRFGDAETGGRHRMWRRPD